MLHPAHLEGHFSHVQAATADAERLLTRDFRAHASAHGLPADLIDHLHVKYDSEVEDFRAGATTSEHQAALEEYEYGTPTRAPMGLVSQFATLHSERAADYLAQSMLARTVTY